jgi:hypothetical protein
MYPPLSKKVNSMENPPLPLLPKVLRYCQRISQKGDLVSCREADQPLSPGHVKSLSQFPIPDTRPSCPWADRISGRKRIKRTRRKMKRKRKRSSLNSFSTYPIINPPFL